MANEDANMKKPQTVLVTLIRSSRNARNIPGKTDENPNPMMINPIQIPVSFVLQLINTIKFPIPIIVRLKYSNVVVLNLVARKMDSPREMVYDTDTTLVMKAPVDLDRCRSMFTANA